MDDVFGPSGIGIYICCFDRQWNERVSNLLNEFGTLVSGGGEVCFESEVPVLVAFDCDEFQALSFCAGVDEFENVIVRYKFRQWSFGFHDQMSIEARIFG